MKTLAAALVSTALLAAACGGKVVFDDGSGGSGGSSTQTGTTSSSKSSTTSTSSVSTGSGGLAGCETYGFGGIGGFCNMQEGVTCLVAYSCCGEVEATCTKNVWTVSKGQGCKKLCAPCGGGLSCDTGNVCVIDQLDVGNTFLCAPNPCPNQPLDCSCGEAACGQSFLQCANVMQPSTIVCDCPTC